MLHKPGKYDLRHFISNSNIYIYISSFAGATDALRSLALVNALQVTSHYSIFQREMFPIFSHREYTTLTGVTVTLITLYK